MTDPKTLTREQVEEFGTTEEPLCPGGLLVTLPLDDVALLVGTALAEMDQAARWESEHADTTVSLLMATRRAEKADAELAEARATIAKQRENADTIHEVVAYLREYVKGRGLSTEADADEALTLLAAMRADDKAAKGADDALAEVERLRAERDAALAMLRHTASILDSCGKTSPHYQRTQREYEPGHGGEHCLCRWCAAARTVTDVAALLDGAEEVSDAE